jgi:hypothetical protein
MLFRCARCCASSLSRFFVASRSIGSGATLFTPRLFLNPDKSGAYQFFRRLALGKILTRGAGDGEGAEEAGLHYSRGASSPAKPAFIIPEPLSITSARTSSTILFICLEVNQRESFIQKN